MGAAAAAVGIFTFGAGLWGADKQHELEKERALLGYEDNLEKIRRRGYTQEQIKGQTKARSENAGVLHTAGSTPKGYVDAMASEFKKELDWMKEYAERAKRLGVESANVNRKIGGLNAFSDGVNAGMSIYGMG